MIPPDIRTVDITDLMLCAAKIDEYHFLIRRLLITKESGARKKLEMIRSFPSFSFTILTELFHS
jgi:hypothetical protein